jgi:hypothetical protein
MAGPKNIYHQLINCSTSQECGGLVPFTQWLALHSIEWQARPKIRYHQALAALLQGVGVVPFTQWLALHSIEWQALQIPVFTVN